MQGKCCCGLCLLSGGTFVALCLSVVQAIVGLFWNAQLLLILNRQSAFDFLKLVVTVEFVKDIDAVHGLTVAAVCLNVFWLFFALTASKGNASLNHTLLTPWVLLTYLITLFDVGCTVYFSLKTQACLAVTQNLFDPSTGHGTVTLTYLTLLILFSRGGFLWFVNVYAAHAVEKRGKEIDQNHSALALYVLSHLSPRRFSCFENPMEFYPDRPRPPSYSRSCPAFMPSPIMARCNSASWSISSENFRNADGFSNPCYEPGTNRSKEYTSIDLARALAQFSETQVTRTPPPSRDSPNGACPPPY